MARLCLCRAVQKAGPEFRAAADLLAACLGAAADCIERGAPYADALGERFGLAGTVQTGHPAVACRRFFRPLRMT